MDRILIKDLLVRCVLGLSPEERREKQDVLISVALITDLKKPGRSDRFEDAVDYRAVKKDVLAAAESSSFHVVELSDVLAPNQLKQMLRRTEEALGRQRGSDRYAPRPIDLDLLIYGDLVCNSDELRLPHPTILERPFVAIPLLELAPDLVIPGSGATLRSLVATISPYSMEPLPDLTDELRKELSNGP